VKNLRIETEVICKEGIQYDLEGALNWVLHKLQEYDRDVLQNVFKWEVLIEGPNTINELYSLMFGI
jgi:hypothetical protein